MRRLYRTGTSGYGVFSFVDMSLRANRGTRTMFATQIPSSNIHFYVIHVVKVV